MMIEIQTQVGKRRIGKQAPCFIVAELSGNHLGNFERAKALIDAAAEAHVDAVKLQTYTPDTLTINCKLPSFIIGQAHPQWAGLSLYELYSQSHTPWAWHEALIQYAHEKQLTLFSTPFDTTAVDFLTSFDLPLIKIASFMVENTLLLEKIGQTEKPVILSTGLTTEADLSEALHILKSNGTRQIILLHCISAYPAQPEQMHLCKISELAQHYNLEIGLSDHSLTDLACIASLPMGVCVIEKHLTLSRGDGGPDCAFSLEPDEFKKLVQNIRATESALKPPSLSMQKTEEEGRIFKQSIYAVQTIPAGAVLNENNIRIIRPGYGLAPKYYKQLLGEKTKHQLEIGEAIRWEDVDIS